MSSRNSLATQPHTLRCSTPWFSSISRPWMNRQGRCGAISPSLPLTCAPPQGFQKQASCPCEGFARLPIFQKTPSKCSIKLFQLAQGEIKLHNFFPSTWKQVFATGNTGRGETFFLLLLIVTELVVQRQQFQNHRDPYFARSSITEFDVTGIIF